MQFTTLVSEIFDISLLSSFNGRHNKKKQFKTLCENVIVTFIRL